MGKRGPARTPTETLKMRGSWLADARKGEPEPDAVVPLCPDWLDETARLQWDRLTKELEMLGLISQIDQTALALHCQSLSVYQAALAEVDVQGFTVTTDKGNIVQNPAVGVMNKAWEQVLKSGAKFGLSPADRAGMAAGEKGGSKKDGKGRFFQKTG